MIIIDDIEKLKKILIKEKKEIGFVPTMGSLHDGHISLIKKARSENEIVVVSIFVNPTQFLIGEDLSKYPRKDEADKKICELCEVDYLFMPNIEMMYGVDEVLIKAPKISSFILEGESRPGHFDGVLQIVLKLFNIVKPKNAYFGKKDAQQLSLINQMVEDLYLDVNIVECEIVRESDGLAFSSRNIYLSKEERLESLKISQSIKLAAKLIGKEQLNVSLIINEMKSVLESELITIEYINMTDRKFKSIEKIEIKNTIVLVAVKIGTTRLIDNIWI